MTCKHRAHIFVLINKFKKKKTISICALNPHLRFQPPFVRSNCNLELCISYFLAFLYILSHIQFSSVSQSCPTLCHPMNHNTPGLPVHTNSQSLSKLMSIELVMPSRHVILCRPLLLLPPIPPSIRDIAYYCAFKQHSILLPIF